MAKFWKAAVRCEVASEKRMRLPRLESNSDTPQGALTLGAANFGSSHTAVADKVNPRPPAACIGHGKGTSFLVELRRKPSPNKSRSASAGLGNGLIVHFARDITRAGTAV